MNEEELKNSSADSAPGRDDLGDIKKEIQQAYDTIDNNSIVVKVINTSGNSLPNYQTPGSAAVDLRADLHLINSTGDLRGDYVKLVIHDGEKMVRITPGGRVLIPTGLQVALPEGFVLSVKPRSGLAIKYGISIVNSPGTIDSDYRGDIGVILINHGDEDFTIKHGDRIAQMQLSKYKQIEWKRVQELDDTERGEGGFNSTGVK